MAERAYASGLKPTPSASAAIAKDAVDRAAVAPDIVRQSVDTPERPLDSAAWEYMEPRSGHDFSRVRIQPDESVPASARAMGTPAFALGRDGDALVHVSPPAAELEAIAAARAMLNGAVAGHKSKADLSAARRAATTRQVPSETRHLSPSRVPVRASVAESRLRATARRPPGEFDFARVPVAGPQGARAEQPLQRFSDGPSPIGILANGHVHPSIESEIDAARGRGRPLERSTRERLEPGLDESLRDVRVHADAHAGALARAVSARAFTVGSDLFFAPGEYRPGCQDGDALIAHEATHAVQQRGAPAHGPLTVSTPGDAYELEADVMASATQRTVGDRAVSRLRGRRAPALQVARWSIPLQGGVPTGTKSTTLADFIDIIRAVEAKFPASEQVNTQLMITRLRKLFYGIAGWDEHLIPGAKPVAPVYPVKEIETGRRDWKTDLLWPQPLEYVDKRTELDVKAPTGTAESKLKDPASIQEVLMPNGDFVDLGHVLAGLDALNHPSAVSAPVGSYAVSSNVGAVTWLGDLGSILAEVRFQRAKLGHAPTDPEVQTQIDLMAPVQDMLGNVDAYAIGAGAAFAISSTAGKKVSDMLLEYYGSSPSTGSRSQRFTTFASKIGLGMLSGASFIDEKAWQSKYEVEVGNAAALYVGAGTHVKGYVNPTGWGGLAGLMLSISNDPLRRAILEEFLRQLKVKVAAEAAAAASGTPSPPPGTPTPQR